MVAGQLGSTIHSVALCTPAAVLRDDALRGQLQGATYDTSNLPYYVPIRDSKLTRKRLAELYNR